MSQKILRLATVWGRYGLSRSTGYLHISRRLIPTPISLGSRAVGLPETEVDAILAARIAGKSDAEIRELVEQLEAARKTAMTEVDAILPARIAGKSGAEIRESIEQFEAVRKTAN